MNCGLAISSANIYLYVYSAISSFVFLLERNLLISLTMSENVSPQMSESFMQREDWLVLLTGGLISSGAIGWLVYRDCESYQLDYKALMAIAASFAGGMGIYFTGSALIYKWKKSNDGQGKSISKKDAFNLTALDRETLCEMFANLVIELEKKCTMEASVRKVLDEIITDKVQEASKVPFNSEDMTKRLNYFNRKRPRNGLKLSIDKQIEICSNGDLGSRKAIFKEEILSFVNELKGYVQGTIDPIPSTETSDEMRQQIIMIVKEYAESISPKLEKVIDDFMDSVCKGVNVLDNDKEHKIKKAFETLGVSENDLSRDALKIEMNQFYNALENATKNKSRMPSCQNGQRSENALEANTQRLESISSPKLNERNTRVKTSEYSLPVMPKLGAPNFAGIPFKSKEANKPGTHAAEKLKNPQSAPVKLSLTQEQMNYLKILKSEM